MNRRRGAKLLLICGVLIVGLSSCVRSSTVASAQGKEIDQLPPELVPASIEGLFARHEDMRAGLDKVKRSYVQSAGLWSFRRQDDQVQATLQIVEFFDQPRYTRPSFRQTIVNQISSTRPKETSMGGHTVYRTVGSDQTTALWFEGRHMFLLSIRKDFPKRRALIRQTLEIAP